MLYSAVELNRLQRQRFELFRELTAQIKYKTLKLQKLSLQEVIQQIMLQDIYQCKSSKEGTMVIVKLLPPARGSPENPAAKQQKYDNIR